jgi:hypothetical protein
MHIGVHQKRMGTHQRSIKDQGGQGTHVMRPTPQQHLQKQRLHLIFDPDGAGATKYLDITETFLVGSDDAFSGVT